MRHVLSLLFLVSLLAAGSMAAEDVPITAADLLEHDGDWPYRVTVVTEDADPGSTLRKGSVGVLIRVLPEQRARIDFGRDGLHELAIDATDLVASANAIRTGQQQKQGPNLALAIGPRLLDPAAPSLSVYGFEKMATAKYVVSVFVEPSPEGLAEAAQALGSLRNRHGLLVVVFPQGRVPDRVVRRRLREAGFDVPFVIDHLAEAYTPSLLGDSAALPSVLVSTIDGRLLLLSGLDDRSAERVLAALGRDS